MDCGRGVTCVNHLHFVLVGPQSSRRGDPSRLDPRVKPEDDGGEAGDCRKC